MAASPNRLEFLWQQAYDLSQQQGAPIAREPYVIVPEGAPALAERIHVSLDDIVDFSADHFGVDPSLLSAMSVHLQGGSVLREPHKAYLARRPEIVDGEIRLPAIHLSVMGYHRYRMRALNHDFRHELAHVFQPEKVPSYRNPRVINTLRGLGSVGAVASGVPVITQSGELGAPASLGLSLAFGASIISAASPRVVAWFCNRQELGAEMFSYRTSNFRPLSLE